MSRDYGLGAPMRGMLEWVGTLFRKRSRPTEFLEQSSRVFGQRERF
mgnify:CR=1 FL=1